MSRFNWYAIMESLGVALLRARPLADPVTLSPASTAYLGTTMPHFPKLFLMYGPNTNLGAGSIIAMLDAQARCIQKVLASGVWAQCSSWYRLPNGRIPTNWPGTVGEYRRRTARFDANDFA